MKKGMIIAGVAIVALMLVLIGVVLAIGTSPEPVTYEEHIMLGNKYMAEQDYDKAILEYKKAITVDDTQEQAYLNLFSAYRSSGLESLAQLALEDGLRRTGGASIRSTLWIYFPLSDALENKVDVDLYVEDKTEVVMERGDASLRREQLVFLGTATYEDYCRQYGNVNCDQDGDRVIGTAQGLDAFLVFYDADGVTSVDKSTGRPYSQARPREIVFEKATMLFENQTLPFVADLGHLPGVVHVEKTDSEIRITAYDCELVFAATADGEIDGDRAASIIPTPASVAGGNYILTGYVVDAATGNTVPNVNLTVYEAISGVKSAESVSESSGKYTIYLDSSGRYYVELDKNGYIQEKVEVYIGENSLTTVKDLTISGVLRTEEIRIVLTWGSQPSDLDSHLNFQMDNGTTGHVYYNYTSVYSNGNLIASLDVDDLDGYGPETTTIYNPDGVFDFSVIDYGYTGTISSSGAQVKIYQGSALLYTLNVPAGLTNSWSVCRIDHGKVVSTNG